MVTVVSFALGFGYQIQAMGLCHGLLPSGLPPFSSQACWPRLCPLEEICTCSGMPSLIDMGLSILKVSSQCPQSPPPQQMLQSGLVSPLPEVRMSPEVASLEQLPLLVSR